MNRSRQQAFLTLAFPQKVAFADAAALADRT
jgi:hypothetical protein